MGWRAELAHLDEQERQTEESRRLMKFLDMGHGDCCLFRPEIADIVQEGLLHLHGRCYDLKAWVVMPNHVHTVMTQQGAPIADVVHSW